MHFKVRTVLKMAREPKPPGTDEQKASQTAVTHFILS